MYMHLFLSVCLYLSLFLYVYWSLFLIHMRFDS